jgi:TolB-like protein
MRLLRLLPVADAYNQDGTKERYMKRLVLLITVIFMAGSLAVAQPTTAPSAQITKVLIVPFKQLGDTSSRGWIGSAIQENLMSNVAASSVTEAVALNHPLAGADKSEVIHAANGVGASIAVFGSYQLSSDQLRVTGQAVDVASGKVLATLRATGPVTDLFKMEDTLGTELTSALPQPPDNLPQVTYGQAESAAPYNNGATAPDATAVAPPQATYAYSAPTYVYPPTTYVYPSYGYSYSYPYYYNYPYVPFYFNVGVPYYGYRGGWGGYRNHWYGYHGGAHFDGGHAGFGGHGGHR